MISTKYVNFKEKEKTIEIFQSESQQSRRIYLYCAARVFKGTVHRFYRGRGVHETIWDLSVTPFNRPYRQQG